MANITVISIPGGTHGHAGGGGYSSDATYADADMQVPDGYGYVTSFFNMLGDFLNYLGTSLTSIAASVAAAAASAAAALVSQNAAAASATLAQQYAAALNGTSTSSVTLGAGVGKTLTTGANKQFAAGMNIQVLNDASHYEYGQVTAYNATTGLLTYTVPATSGYVVGSGTFTSWTIQIAGIQGPVGVTGVPGNTQLSTGGGTLIVGTSYQVDTTGISGGISNALPTSPNIGDSVWAEDSGNACGACPATFTSGSNKLNGITGDSYVLNVNGGKVQFVWAGGLIGWRARIVVSGIPSAN